MNASITPAEVSGRWARTIPKSTTACRVSRRFSGSYWRDLDQREAYPAEFVKALTAAGYLAALIPEEYGGAGLPLRPAGVVLEECHAAGCYAAAAHAQMYTMGSVLRHGTPEQKARYLPQIASGELRLQAFGVTEPTTGSDTTKLKTRAVRDGDHYVVNGQKVWTSRALHSDLMLLLVRTTPLDQVARKTEGLSVLLVDIRESLGKGMEIRPLKAMINHNTTEVFIENLRVPAENLIGGEGKGFRCILDGMNAERILVSHDRSGTRWFTRTASKYASERIVFDRPIGQNQGIQFPIARAYAEMQATDMMLRKAAAFRRGPLRRGMRTSRSCWPADAAWHAAEACMQTHGGFGYAREYDVERRWREARHPADRAGVNQPHPCLHRRARARHAALVLSVARNPP
jgi:alkylation response protein AidB-like acyl-CoA dehydrogenase